MNRNQKVVVAVGFALFLLMGIYPPWIFAPTSKALGYSLIFVAPSHNGQVDIARLGIQWLMVVISTIFCYFALRTEAVDSDPVLLVVCPKCKIKNRIAYPPRADVAYRCKVCKSELVSRSAE